MRRWWAVVLIMTAALGAEPVWIDGPTLAVSVHPDGSLTVRRKSSGRVWRTQVPPAPPTIAIRQAAAPPTIDGDAADWADVPAITIDSKLVADMVQVDSDADCSAVAKAQWDGAGLYLLLQVTDDLAELPADPDLQWWDHDSAELWVNGSQFGLAIGRSGAVVSRIQRADDAAKVVSRPQPPSAGGPGYVVESFVPWASVTGDAVNAIVGGQIRFAVGLNDADGAGREGQLYWPATWKHSTPTSFAIAALGDTTGNVPGGLPEPQPVVTDLRRDGDSIRFGRRMALPGGATAVADVAITPQQATDELVITVNVPDPEAPFTGLEYPEPLAAELPNGQVFFADYANGLLLPQTDPKYQNRTLWGWGIDLPFVGICDGATGDGYLLLLDTPFDGGIRLTSLRGEDGERRMVPQAVWQPRLGKFGEARKIRLIFSDSGGYVALAKRYRAIAEQQGFLKTLRQKMEQRPAIARLAGAPDVWGGGLDWAKEASTYGVDRGIINTVSTRAAHDQLDAMGFLTSKYDNYVDLIIEEDKSKWDHVLGPREHINVRQDGELQLGWLTYDKQKQYYKRSSVFMAAQARIDIPKELAIRPYLGRFLDVTTASGLLEDWAPDRMRSREDDMRQRNELFRYVNEVGLVTGGEHGRWWAVPYMDYFEGLMSGYHFSWPAGHLRLPDEGLAGISDEYREYGLGGAKRIPLWELVFGDCTVDYWYWGDSNGYLHSLDPKLSDRKDAFNVLYGTPPMYWVSSTHSFGWSTDAGRKRLLQSFLHTSPWHRAVMFEEMLTHEALTEDRLVQKTTFSGGYQAVVNLADEPRTVSIDGKPTELPSNGFVASGPDFQLSHLAVNGRLVTHLRTPEFAYVDGGGAAASVPGILTQSRCLVKIVSPSELWIAKGSEGVLNPKALVPDWDLSGQRLFYFDERGQLLRAEWRSDERLDAWGGAKRGPVRILTGEHTKPADLFLAALRANPPTPKQGEPVTLEVEVWNEGRTAAAGARLMVELEGRTLLDEAIDLGAGRGDAVDANQPAHVTKSIELPTADLDGLRRIRASVTMPEGVAEPFTTDNQRELALTIAPDRAKWPAQPLATAVVEPAEGIPVDAIVELPVTVPDASSPASLRVWDPAAGMMLPSQFEPDTPGARRGKLVCKLPGELTAPRRLEILAAPANSTILPAGGGTWRAAEQVIDAPGYRFSLAEGYPHSITDKLGTEPNRPVIDKLVYSSAQTGWNDEPGTVQSLELVASGPVRTVVRVKKTLKDGLAVVTRTIRCYDRWFEIETDADPTVTALHVRAFYLRGGEYTDSRGKSTVIDGVGDDDAKISGEAPTWLAVRGEGWAHSFTNLLPGGGLQFWDAGGWGGLGYLGSASDSRVAVAFHPAMADDSFAAADAARLRARVRVRVE